MELVTVKLIVLAISGLVRIFFGMIPFVVIKILARSVWSKGADRRMKKVISILMFFGGGVLLATCFLHMMPEVRDSLREAEPELELPLSEIIFLAGFFLVYIIEDIVHSIIHQRRSRKAEAKQATASTDTNKMGKQNKSSNINANQSFSGRTGRTAEDKGLHNNEDMTINVATTNGSNIAATAFNDTPNAAASATNSQDSLSFLSVEAQHRGQVACSNQLRETKKIFRKNGPHADEIPGLAKSRLQNGMGGITNAGFVPEKFQYYDSDWLKDIVNNANSAISLPRGRRSICSELIFNGVFDAQNKPAQNESDQEAQNNIHHNNHQVDSPHSSTISNNNNASLHAHQQHSQHRNHPKKQHNHSHMPIASESEIDQSIGAEIRNILIVIAISFHGIFEGMAIGLQGSEADVWYLFLAVSLHECTILFCIGVELISSKTKVFRMVLYLLVVSLVSPVGIGIGILISEREYGKVLHQALVVGCFQGLAAGTLLYVIFFEIFQEEGKKLHRKCYHILIAVLGFVLMGSLEFMGGHHHGESNGLGSNCSTGHHEHGGHDDHDH